MIRNSHNESISGTDLYKFYRRIVPCKNYYQCEGCHAGKKLCPAVTTLHEFCPCSDCIVKVRCSNYCEEYLKSFKIAIDMNKRVRFLAARNPAISFRYKKKKKKLLISVEMWLNEKSDDGNKSLHIYFDDL